MNNKKTQSLMKLKAGKEAIQKLLKTQAYKMPNPEVLKFMELLERTNQAIKHSRSRSVD